MEDDNFGVIVNEKLSIAIILIYRCAVPLCMCRYCRREEREEKKEMIPKKLKKKAKRAGWIAGETPLSDLSIEELSRMCGLHIVFRYRI